MILHSHLSTDIKPMIILPLKFLGICERNRILATHFSSLNYLNDPIIIYFISWNYLSIFNTT